MLYRLLTFFIGLPLLVLIVVFLPLRNHLVFNLVVLAMSVFGAAETADIIKKRNLPITLKGAGFFGGIPPLAALLAVSFGMPIIYLGGIVTITLVLLMARRIFDSQEKMADALPALLADFCVFIYPGMFLSWAIMLNGLSNDAAAMIPAGDTVILVVYLLTVIINDSLAWVCGMLFGKGNRGLVAASPNKSVAGFAGGLVSSIIICAAFGFFFPEVFPETCLPRVAALVVLGLLTGAAAIAGDLAESVLKRSCGVKDSGFVIPGRGGVLDSIDSHTLAAPVFYLCYRLMFVS
jgi:phosphatidate cytidylyltransferase